MMMSERFRSECFSGSEHEYYEVVHDVNVGSKKKSMRDIITNVCFDYLRNSINITLTLTIKGTQSFYP